MKQLVIEYDWYMYKRCRCGGSLKEKFKHPSKPSQEIWIYPNKNKWEYRTNRTVMNQNIGVDTLRSFLEGLG